MNQFISIFSLNHLLWPDCYWKKFPHFSFFGFIDFIWGLWSSAQLIVRVFSYLKSIWWTIFHAFSYLHYMSFIFVLLPLEYYESAFTYLWVSMQLALTTLLSIALEYLYTFILEKVSHSFQTSTFIPVCSIFYVLIRDYRIMLLFCLKSSIDTWSWLRAQWWFVSFYWVISIALNVLYYWFVVSKPCSCFLVFPWGIWCFNWLFFPIQLISDTCVHFHRIVPEDWLNQARINLIYDQFFNFFDLTMILICLSRLI